MNGAKPTEQTTRPTTPKEGEKRKGLTLNPEFEAAIHAMEAQYPAPVVYRSEPTLSGGTVLVGYYDEYGDIDEPRGLVVTDAELALLIAAEQAQAKAEREKCKAMRCDLLRARKATEMARQAERSNHRHAKRKYGVVDAPGTLADFFEDVESRLVSAWVDCCILRSREVNQ